MNASIPREVKVLEGSEAEEAAERTGEKSRDGPEATKLPTTGANQRRRGSRRRTGRGNELGGREVTGQDL